MMFAQIINAQAFRFQTQTFPTRTGAGAKEYLQWNFAEHLYQYQIT